MPKKLKKITTEDQFKTELKKRMKVFEKSLIETKFMPMAVVCGWETILGEGMGSIVKGNVLTLGNTIGEADRAFYISTMETFVQKMKEGHLREIK